MAITTGIVAGDISYTLSPIIHSFIYQSNIINGGFASIMSDPEDLGNTIQQLQKYGFTGLSITNPHKVEVMKHCHHLSSDAESIGAVNCITFGTDGKVYGDNTDIYGLQQQLQHDNIQLDNSKILIIGAGGAAKSLYKIVEGADYKSLVIANRTVEKVSQYQSQLPNCTVTDLDILNTQQEFDVIFNTISVGHAGEDFIVKCKALKAAVDIVYSKDGVTSFLANFANRDNRPGKVICSNGISMLIYQAYRSFDIWMKAAGIDKEITRDYYRLIDIIRNC